MKKVFGLVVVLLLCNHAVRVNSHLVSRREQVTKGGKSIITYGGKGPEDAATGFEDKRKMGLMIKEKENVVMKGKGGEKNGGDKKDKKNKDEENSEPISKTDKLIKGVSPTIPPVNEPMTKTAKSIVTTSTQPKSTIPVAKPPTTKAPVKTAPVATSPSPSVVPTCLECDDVGS
jgi:hypothetical protein